MLGSGIFCAMVNIKPNRPPPQKTSTETPNLKVVLRLITYSFNLCSGFSLKCLI